MLASIAQRAGLVVEGLWVLRRKRVAVQQRARGRVTSTGGRESVLLHAPSPSGARLAGR